MKFNTKLNDTFSRELHRQEITAALKITDLLEIFLKEENYEKEKIYHENTKEENGCNYVAGWTSPSFRNKFLMPLLKFHRYERVAYHNEDFPPLGSINTHS
jgi:hypothetical protein